MQVATSVNNYIVVTADYGGASQVASPTIGQLISAWRLSGISAAEIDTTELSSLTKTCILGVKDMGMLELDMFIERNVQSNRAIIQRSIPTTPSGNWKIDIASDDWEFEIEMQGQLQSVIFDLSIDEAVKGTYSIRLSSFQIIPILPLLTE